MSLESDRQYSLNCGFIICPVCKKSLRPDGSHSCHIEQTEYIDVPVRTIKRTHKPKCPKCGSTEYGRWFSTAIWNTDKQQSGMIYEVNCGACESHYLSKHAPNGVEYVYVEERDLTPVVA
jgi:predicted nucleic-acid-binding Zn-ribbon protein